jgi:hypothetical protein
MLTLVKTVKTLGLSDRLEWSQVDKRLVGVTNLGKDTIGMSFRVKGYGTTRLSAKNNNRSIMFMTLHDTSSPARGVEQGVEKALLDRILDASGINNSPVSRRIRSQEEINNYLVFRMHPEEPVNILLLEHRLRGMGLKTVLDFQVHRALVVKFSGVTWHFFSTENVLAVVGGSDLAGSISLVEESWKVMNSN